METDPITMLLTGSGGSVGGLLAGLWFANKSGMFGNQNRDTKSDEAAQLMRESSRPVVERLDKTNDLLRSLLVEQAEVKGMLSSLHQK